MAKRLAAIIIAFLYSLAYTVLGPMCEAQDFTLHLSQLFAFLVCFVICTLINCLLFSVCPRWHKYLENEWLSKQFEKLGNKSFFFLTWVFIIILWIPAYLVFYPGVLSYDILSQEMSALGTITSNHHPVLHTWLIRVFMNLGKNYLSGYEDGIGLLSLLQMVLLSYALSRLVLLLKTKGVPSLLVLLSAICSALWFVNQCLSVTMVKDTLHAAFLVLFVCHFTEIATDPWDYIQQKQNLILLPVIAFFMCAFRNNGIHIYLFCFGALLLLRIPKIKSVKKYVLLIVAVLLPVFLFKLYSGPLFNVLGIEQGEVREAISVPIQQLQRIAVSKTEELTDEQTKLMDYYIDNLEWRTWEPGRIYDPFFADPAKSCFYSGNYNNNPIAFWKFYFQMGIQYPKEYIAAFLSNTLGYWYPGYYRFSYVMYDNYPPELFVEPLERKSIGNLQALMKYYESVCMSDFWRDIPILRVFFVSGFSIWFLIYAIVLAWRKKSFFSTILPVFLPLIAQYGIMILSPMSSFRYAWPFYLMLPLSLIGIFGKTEECCMEERCGDTPEGENESINTKK